MNRFALTVLICLFSSMPCLAASAKITFEKTKVDFGTVGSGAAVDMEFKFKNTGDGNLIIKNWTASSGALAVKIDKKEYKPGQSGVFRIQFHTRGYVGKLAKSVVVVTNDAENRTTRLVGSGTVNLKEFAAVELSTDKVDFEKVGLGKKLSRTIKLKNTGTVDLRIIEVTHGVDISLDFPARKVAPGCTIDVVVNFKALEPGRYVSFVKIRSNAYRQRITIVKVSAIVAE